MIRNQLGFPELATVEAGLSGADMSDDANRRQQHNEMERVELWDLRRCHRAIRERIGQELQRRYRPPQDMPDRLMALLVQISGAEDDSCCLALDKNEGGHRGAANANEAPRQGSARTFT